MARVTTLVVISSLLVGANSLSAQAATYPSDNDHPNLVSLLDGFGQLWQRDSSTPLHGQVKDAPTLAYNDEMAVWINNHATSEQQLKALQDANYDPAQLIGTGLGSKLAPIYIKGLQSGALPLTSQLMGSMLAYAQTDAAKNAYNYPRPYLPTSSSATGTSCDATQTNGSSLTEIRVGARYADAEGNLKIQAVPDGTDTTGVFNAGSAVSAGYGGYCASPSFPSGHTTNAYLTGIMLATMLPQLAPDVLARASEMGTDRVVLGIHYPLDIIGGRISGQAEVAARWADAPYRDAMITPAQRELVNYLQTQCGATLSVCISSQESYQDDPFGGANPPGGSSQIVTDTVSAMNAYHERLTYGFAQNGTAGQKSAVPATAPSLLQQAYPSLSDAQRSSVLAQTEIDSGYPLDQTGGSDGSWQRLDLASAMSATVQLNTDGAVRVLSTGGTPKVVTEDSKPILTASAGSSVMAGNALGVVGAGFTAGGTYRIVWAGDHKTVLGTATADATGGISTSVVIPVNTAPGAQYLDVLDASDSSMLAKSLAITVTATDYQQSVTTKSPDGATAATVYVDSVGQLGYTVAQNGQTVIQRSRLGLVVDGTDWGADVTLGEPVATKADTSYPLIGTHDTGSDRYNANTIPVQKSGSSLLGVEIRVFDTGVAVRYDLDKALGGKLVTSEGTTFVFDPASTIAYQPVTPGTIDDLQGDTSQGVLGSVGQQKIVVTPTIQTPDSKEYVNLVEANVRDWPAIALTTSPSGSISTYYWATDNGNGSFTVSPNTLHSPFRVLTIAPDLNGLTNSDVITAVNDPVDTSVFPGGDTNWIRPGVSAWASLAPGQNYMTQSVSLISRLIDDASAAHESDVLIEGMLTEASWGKTPDERFANLKKLVQQGLNEPNPVSVWLWSDYNTGAGTNDAPTFYGTKTNNLQNADFRDIWLQKVAETGVVGVKIDHIGDETETKVNIYADIDKAAARRHLMVTFHNPLEPTGLNRTYPNEVGREAIRGVEINYAADQNTRLPFTRYVDGTADYTPLIFSNPSKQNNATWAHEVASTVVFTNPYLQVSEDPANLKPGGKYHDLIGDLIANMPTAWKRSTVLPQSTMGGRLAGFVRETTGGEYWIAVVATPGSPVSTTIPLDFLPKDTTYNADIYADGHSASSLSRTTQQVTRDTVLKPTLTSGGGYLVRVTTKKIDNPVGHYSIASEADLDLLRQHPSSTFDLTKDITLTRAWTPVDSFTGELNGNGHTISGLSISTNGNQAFITENDGTIRQLGFSGATSTAGGGSSAGIVTEANNGTIDQVYVLNGSLTSAYRAGMITAQNYGTVSNTYTAGTVTGDWESAGIAGWNSGTAAVTNSYSTAAVTTRNGNAGIVSGVGATVTNDVALGGSVTGNNTRRVAAGGSLSHNLALNTIQINGKTVSSTSDTDGNGADTTAESLAQQATYAGLGWDFGSIWAWDATSQRPVLAKVAEVGGSTASYTITSEADLAQLPQHPNGTFNLTADIFMTKPWTPVPSFTGTINGNGHTITGLKIDGVTGTGNGFIVDNKGTIRQLGFISPSAIISVTKPTDSSTYNQNSKIAVVATTNNGTIDQVYTEKADVRGGWRTAPIAAENYGTVSNSYTADSTVVSNWETGALVGWNNTGASVTNSYVAGANVTAVSSNGGILSGYAYGASGSAAATKFTGDVVYSGALTIPGSGNKGRVNGQERNGSPAYSKDLALDTAAINGSTISGGAADNKNGQDTSAADLKKQSTYTGIGWDFDSIWKMDATLDRPVLRVGSEPDADGAYTLASEADLALIALHPGARFTMTDDITLTKPWTPVPMFTGTIDGKGHTLTDVKLTALPGRSNGFIVKNTGVIRQLGFVDPVAIIPVADPDNAGSYDQNSKIAVVATTNDGTIDQVYTRGADVEGGWRTAPIAAENTGTVSNSYTLDSKVVSNWETGALIGWSSSTGVIKNNYVAGANVTAISSNGAIFTGYGYTGTQLIGNVIYSGALTIPVGANVNKGRILARDNGNPVYTNNLSLDAATINGAVVTGGGANTKDGQDTNAADLRKQATYSSIGWDFDSVWKMDAALGRPILQSVREVRPAPTVAVTNPDVVYQAGSKPTAEDLLQRSGATTTAGTLNIDTTAVDFTTPGSYTAQVGAEFDGSTANTVPVTIQVVPVIAIQLQHPELSYQQGTTLSEATVEGDLGISLSTEGMSSVDLSALDTATVGTYTVTVTATDSYGFTATPVDAVIRVTEKPVTPPQAKPMLTAPSGTTLTQGETFTLQGSQFAANARLEVVLHSTPVQLGTVVTDAKGAFTVAVTIPGDTQIGTHSIDIVDASGHSALTTPLKITVLKAVVVDHGDQPLASTGITISIAVVFVSLLALLVGLGLVLLNRRRRKAHSTDI
ncbi:glycoside hydrolase family 97 catalytic domain-containing protein [Plantibacter sp. Mn2098]|uniref:glycoside hydrolase family 97 catalytic domain-containing protein n=1 Tax=Plantibacter sp. Mn2098 TaxID=3395266 RepID=UPI003BC672D9